MVGFRNKAVKLLLCTTRQYHNFCYSNVSNKRTCSIPHQYWDNCYLKKVSTEQILHSTVQTFPKIARKWNVSSLNFTLAKVEFRFHAKTQHNLPQIYVKPKTNLLKHFWLTILIWTHPYKIVLLMFSIK